MISYVDRKLEYCGIVQLAKSIGSEKVHIIAKKLNTVFDKILYIGHIKHMDPTYHFVPKVDPNIKNERDYFLYRTKINDDNYAGSEIFYQYFIGRKVDKRLMAWQYKQYIKESK